MRKRLYDGVAVSIGELTDRHATPEQKEELRAILESEKKCDVCQSAYVDEKKRYLKVR